MDLITTHNNTDLDGLASMVAAQRLYPGAQMVFPGKLSCIVAEFMALYKDTFRVKKSKEVELSKVKRLILVDFKNPSRVANLKPVLENPGLEVHIYDHHPWGNGDVRGKTEVVEMVGAATTLLVEEIKKREIKLNPLEATLMLMGIYDDTGCLLFTSTTPRDVYAAAFLLEQGANLAVAGSFLEHPIKTEQKLLLKELIDSAEILSVNGIQVVVAGCISEEYVDGLATLTHKMIEIENSDAAFVLAEMEGRIHIIGRSVVPEVNIKNILSEMGGRGHPAAASASIKGKNLPAVLARIKEIIHDKVKPRLLIRDIMSSPVKTVTPETTIDAAMGIMLRYGHSGLPVVSGHEVVGVISRRDVEKAVHHGLGHAPVKGYMTRNVFVTAPGLPVSSARELMIEKDIGRLPVVAGGMLVGILSRSDVLRSLHGEYGYQNVRWVFSGSCPSRDGNENFNDLIQRALPTELLKILLRAGELADKAGCGVYAVGGFVRDLLLGEESIDLDLVVEGDSIELSKLLAEEFDGRLTIHEKFKTSAIDFPGGYHVDLASARVEYYEYPAALPKVESSTLRQDLYRRDFTINSMAISLCVEHFGMLIDYYCGYEDLQKGLIRVLHNLSFVEDPTRILRALRFEQRYGLQLEENTGELLKQAVADGMLNRVSKERLWEESKACFSEKNPGKLLRRFGDLGVWTYLFPATSYKDVQGTLEALAGSIKEIESWELQKPMRTWMVYLGAVLHKAEPAAVENVCSQYKLKKKEIEEIKLINKNWRDAVALLRRPGRRTVSMAASYILSLPVESYPLLLTYLEGGKQKEWFHRVIEAIYYNKPYIGGNDIICLGLQPGPVFSKVLNEVWKAKLDGLVRTREEELELAKKFIENQKGD